MSSKSNDSIVWLTDITPASFFHEKIVAAQKRHNIKLTENVEFYLVNLMCEYVRMNSSEETENCLAFLLKEALESSFGKKIFLYKKLGDTALYYSGFLQKYFTNKSFSIKYYINMGESAYSELSSLMRNKNNHYTTMSKIYGEMSGNFLNSVDILLDISEQTTDQKNMRSTLNLYDAWINTGSAKLEKELQERGIQPVNIGWKKC